MPMTDAAKELTALNFETQSDPAAERIAELERELDAARTLLVARERRLASSAVYWLLYYRARDAREWARLTRRLKAQTKVKRPVSARSVRARVGRYLLSHISVDALLAADGRRGSATDVFGLTRVGDASLEGFRRDRNLLELECLTRDLEQRCGVEVEARLDGSGDILGRVTFECNMARSDRDSLEASA